ncbi:UNC-50 [Tribonema minus]|uniref:UNC-50 n=1 Tax=Tribonema minus TaxID=303371 RepID=A0A835Z945_9STRA|nr:UNC-50 [Tribonema minus]
MLPLDGRNGRYAPHRRHSSYGGDRSVPEYFARLFDFKQLDMESACDQMVTLLSLNPGRVYKTAYYRKQTKNQWARDDPAFAVLQLAFSVAGAVAYGMAFGLRAFWGYIALIANAVLLHWLLFGVAAATAGRALANAHMLVRRAHSVEQRVEWLYAFDIHCNAFFMLFIVVYVGQFLLLPVLLGPSVGALLLSNALYALGFGAYFYITHLGYRSLPFLCKTETFLYPVVAVVTLLATSVLLAALGMRVNMTRVMAHVYFL